MMNFVVIGEMVDKLSDDVKENNPNIEWIKIKGFRNLVAHDYFGIDAEEVWQIIKSKIPKLRSDITKLLGWSFNTTVPCTENEDKSSDNNER